MPIYEYKGQQYELPDGLTNDQALMKIKTHLGETQAAPEAAAVPPTPESATRSAPEELARQLGLTARAGITGLTSIPAMAGDALNAVINTAAGRQVVPPASQSIQNLMTAAGLPVPEGGLEKSVQAGASAMAGTGIQALAAKGAQAIQPAIQQFTAPLTQNLGQQVAASAAGGMAGQPAAELVTEATQNPLAGTIAGLAVGTLAGASAGRGASKLNDLQNPQPTLAQIKDRAQEAYRTMENQGVAVKPLSVLKMVDNIEGSLTNFNPVMDSHRPVQQLLDNYRRMIGTTRVSFTSLEQMRSQASEVARSNDAATRRLAGEVLSSIDSYISNLNGRDIIAGKAGLDDAVASVQAARKDWRNLSRATVIEDALNTAEARALDPKASEGDLIRKNLINLLASKDKIRLFSEAEQNAIKSVVKGNSADPVLSLLAKFNPQRNQLITGVTVGASLAKPSLLALPAAGYAADKFLGFTRSQGAQDLARRIAAGNVTTPPSQGVRGMISGYQPMTEEDLKLLQGF